MEILSGGTGSDSKLSHIVKPVKDAKAGKPGGKDGKMPAGGGGGTGVSSDDDKGKAAVEVLSVEPPPLVRGGFFSLHPQYSKILQNFTNK